MGDLLYAQVDEIQNATNNIAEATTILESLGYIVQSQSPPCVIKTDSMLMKQILNKVLELPWNILIQIEEIKRLMTMCTIAVTHVLREVNMLAEHLANLMLEHQVDIQVNSFMEIDTEGRKKYLK